MVLKAAQDDDSGRRALAELCQLYWYPLYAFLRRQGTDQDSAKDLTQGFFTRLIEKADLRKVETGRGTFRSYLLASLKHFAANEWDRQQAQKRGGGQTIVSLDLDLDLQGAEDRYRLEPADTTTPEKLFERRWALTLLETVLDRLQAEMAARGRGPLFQRLKVFLEGDGTGPGYAEIARDLDMSEGAIKVNVHRLRSRFRELLRQEIGHTLEDPDAADAELRHLLGALSGS
jgi:RNA polymerase sigma-70 factor (ECF subfamily)